MRDIDEALDKATDLKIRTIKLLSDLKKDVGVDCNAL